MAIPPSSQKSFVSWIILLAIFVVSLYLYSGNAEKRIARAEKINRLLWNPFVALAKYYHNVNEAFETNAYLNIETTRLLDENRQMMEAQAENQRLRQLLELQEKTPFTSIAARPVAYHQTQHHYLILDKGPLHGIKRNMPVMSPQGVVGKIVGASSANSSLLQLITDDEFRLAVKIQRTHMLGILRRDKLSGAWVIDNLPLYSDVQPGDRVVTSGLGEIFPPDLPVGTVKKIEPKKHLSAIQIFIQPFVDVNSLGEVLIIQYETNY